MALPTFLSFLNPTSCSSSSLQFLPLLHSLSCFVTSCLPLNPFRHSITLSTASGPSTDHSGDRLGHYMFVEASKGTSWSWAELASEVLQPCPTTCQLEFYYHMYGSGVGALYVDIRAADGVSRDTEVLSRSNFFLYSYDILIY